MRINLRDQDDRRQKKRRKERRKRRARSQTFQSALVQPQIRSPRQTEQRRSRRKSRPRPQGSRTDVAAAAVEAPRFRWSSVFRRLPAALVLLGLVAGLIYTSTSAEFFVYEAAIVGAKHLDAAFVYEMAGVHEQNIFWIRPEQVAARIGALDGIKSVRVDCDLLPTAVTIEVEEREPAVLWRALTQERDWWLDEEGVVLPYHGDPYSSDAIFVVDYSERSLDVGDSIQPEGLVDSVQRLAAALPGIQVFFYQAGRGLGFTQRMGDEQWPVYVGTSEDLARKIQVLRALADHLAANNIRPRYVDVRWAEHPVYGRPAAEAAAGGE